MKNQPINYKLVKKQIVIYGCLYAKYVYGRSLYVTYIKIIIYTVIKNV